MIILSLDSTEKTSTAAITDGTRLIAHTTINAGLSHSETLLPSIELLLRGASLSFDDIDTFACSSGPGSFTGVRIGAATIKGLSFGRGKPCVAVSALEALAFNFVGIGGLICPCMDARRSQLYNAIFECNSGEITRLTDDRVIMAPALADELKNYGDGKKIFLCGGGYDIAKDACQNADVSVSETPELLKYENAYSVALCAYSKIKKGLDISSCTDSALSPTYLRPSQAERNRNGE